jgi:glycosyltransferase involved in cell wall biosynthesis
MKASVVIPAYNASKTLPIVLRALQNQDFRDFEVILVDDGSTDDTSSVAKRISGHLDLQIIRNSANQGRAKTRNTGVKHARGDIIILLDSDIETVPNYISAHLRLHESSARTIGIGALRYPPHLAKKALARYYSSRGGARLKPGQPLPGKYFVSGLASFPHALFEEVGGFDERFQSYGSEDLELGLRFQAAGAQIHYLPEAIGYHHHLRPLKEVMATLHQYGREGIPVLLEKHPAFASDLRLDDLTGPAKVRSQASLPRRLLTAAALFHPAIEIASLLQNLPLPSLLLTYLHYAAYRRGFLEYLADMSKPKSKI